MIPWEHGRDLGLVLVAADYCACALAGDIDAEHAAMAVLRDRDFVEQCGGPDSIVVAINRLLDALEPAPASQDADTPRETT